MNYIFDKNNKPCREWRFNKDNYRRVLPGNWIPDAEEMVRGKKESTIFVVRKYMKGSN